MNDSPFSPPARLESAGTIGCAAGQVLFVPLHRFNNVVFAGWLMRYMNLALLMSITILHGAASAGEYHADPHETTTEWRDDVANLDVVEKLNRAFARIPFSQECEGVLDACPVELHWSVGPNVPFPWKGGVAGLIGEEVVLAGGLWMPDRGNRAYAYKLKSHTYAEIPPPPFETAYTQGACDGESLYIVGGRAAGRNVARLSRAAGGEWQWYQLPSLPEPEQPGRWVGTAAVVPGKWLFLLAGHPTGTPFETRDAAALPGWRLPLDRPEARWEPMAPYPASRRALMPGAVVGGTLFVFGGAVPDPEMRNTYLELIEQHELTIAPYKGCHDYRDAFRYDADGDRWERIRSLPFPMAGGMAVALDDRSILIFGSQHVNLPTRVGKTRRARNLKMETRDRVTTASQEIVPYWTGYDDRIVCYDVQLDNYSRVGVMLYGVATSAWVSDGTRVYGFGGEPFHSYNFNTENVLQIGAIKRRLSE